MDIAWATLIANILVALLVASGGSWILARSQRRKYDAESTDLRSNVMTKVDQQTDRALERADRALQRVETLEQYVDSLKQHIDTLEDLLRANGLSVPPAPPPFRWPAPD